MIKLQTFRIELGILFSNYIKRFDMRTTVKFEAFCFRFLGLPDWRRISAIGCIFNLQPHWDWMICLRLAAFTRSSTGLFYYAILAQGGSFNCCSSVLKGEDMNNNTDTLRFWLLGHGHKDNPWSASRLIQLYFLVVYYLPLALLHPYAAATPYQDTGWLFTPLMMYFSAVWRP